MYLVSHARINVGFFSDLYHLTIHAILHIVKAGKIEHKTKGINMRRKTFSLDAVKKLGSRGFDFKLSLLLSFLYL